MSLVSCRECEHEISTEALSCPHCGAPRPAQAGWHGSGVDWRSNTTWMGYPLVHVAYGRDAQGKRRVAKGIIAIGQFAIGGITIAQFGIAFVFGFGQFILGLSAVAQIAIAAWYGIGQFAIGYVAIGQLAAGYYVVAQVGWGRFLWTPGFQDPEAVEFFRQLGREIGFGAG